jgi:sugar phosphate isomerase/epimerase
MNKIILAPTTLPKAPPLEFIDAGAQAGYDALALRLYESPGLPFHPVLGNAPLIRDIKSALASAPPVQEIGSFYLQPGVDIARFSAALGLGAEIGAKYAFVIGNDPEWSRLCDSFGRFCDEAARYGLSAFVEFVPMRPLGSLAKTLQMFGEAGRDNVAVCIDPLNFARSGGRVEDIKTINRKFLPYAQLSDGDVHADEEGMAGPLMRPNVRRMPGEGSAPVADIVAALPAGLPYSLELPLELSVMRPGAKGKMMTPVAWAKYVLDHAKEFLGRHAKM